MLYFLSTFESPRLRYVLDLVLKRILGLTYEVVPIGAYQPEEHFPALNYTSMMLPATLSLPNTGLLAQTDIRDVPLRMRKGSIPYLFYYTVSADSYQLPYDLFSGVFYLATEYEKYLNPLFDQHERYDQQNLPGKDLELDRFPLVHLYAEQLWQAMQKHWGEKFSLPREPREFVYETTFDIDFPWKYRYKGALVSLGGWLNDLRQRSWEKVKERFRALALGQDPNDTYNLIYAHFLPERTRFFFLLDRHAPQDSRFTWKHPQYRTLIQQIAAKGYGIGVHPSYTSFLDRAKLQAEIWALEAIVGKPIQHSRQHFLRYRLPHTYRYLIEHGIRHEYSPCRYAEGGFPNGMALPYPWFDLERNETTALMLHPTQIMDRTLQKYLELSPEAARERVQELIVTTQSVKGTFTLLLHNDCLSESEEWKGWREPILNWPRP
jgi:hypothetical protein